MRVTWRPEEIRPGLHRLPLPYAWGSSVNAFLVEGDEGLLLVDAGHPSEECRAAFDAQLDELGFRRADVRQILLTHADPDHVGLAAGLQADSGAPVLLHPAELDRGLIWQGSEAWLSANGYPGPFSERPFRAPLLPERRQLVSDGSVVEWGDYSFRLIHCPGHTPGLVCAFDERQRLLLSTDHVLRSRTPVGLFEPAGDPLGDYLRSVERLRGLGADLVVPGHGRAFEGLEDRLSAILADHEQELTELAAELGEHPQTAWEITDRRVPKEDRRRAAGTFFVLAVLRHLERTGRAVALEAAGLISYRAA